MRRRAIPLAALLFVLGCGSARSSTTTPHYYYSGTGTAYQPYSRTPNGALVQIWPPPPGGPNATDDGRVLAQVPWEPGALPDIPRLSPPNVGGPPNRPADGNAPTTGVVIDGEKLGHDPGVTVGDHFVMVYTAHKYWLYDRAGHALGAEP